MDLSSGHDFPNPYGLLAADFDYDMDSYSIALRFLSDLSGGTPEDEALAIENASPYGNAAAIFSESGGTARYAMERASAGMVGINVGVPVPREPFSFGGWNDSRFGVGDITGRGSIDFWTQAKKITTKWNRESGTHWMG